MTARLDYKFDLATYQTYGILYFGEDKYVAFEIMGLPRYIGLNRCEWRHIDNIMINPSELFAKTVSAWRCKYYRIYKISPNFAIYSLEFDVDQLNKCDCGYCFKNKYKLVTTRLNINYTLDSCCYKAIEANRLYFDLDVARYLFWCGALIDLGADIRSIIFALYIKLKIES